MHHDQECVFQGSLYKMNMDYKYFLPINLLIICLVLFGMGCLSEKEIKPVEVNTNPTKENLEEYYTQLQKKRISEAPNSQIRVQVSFKRWLTIEELYSIVDKNKSFYLFRVNTYMPTVAHGWSAPLHLGKHRDIDVFFAYLEKKIITYNNINIDFANEVRFAIDNGDVQIGPIVMEGDRQVIEEWWQSNTDLIRLVQLITGPAEESQPSYLPGQSFP